jgi:molybdate/tungstate transport system permease protein
MASRRHFFNAVFALVGGLVLIFILLPILTTFFGTSSRELQDALADGEVMRSLATTLLASSLACLLGFLGGVPLSYLLARLQFPGKRIVEALIDLPIVIPHTAAGIALLMVFGSRGVLGSTFQRIGVIFTDTLAGVAVAMLFVSLPFLINLSREAFETIDIEVEKMAWTDGASPFQVFRLIALPQAWRGVASGVLMMWARGISEFGAVVILAYYPRIVPTLIYERFTGYGLDSARPVAVILIGIVLIIFVILRWLVIPDKDKLTETKQS